MDVRCDKCGTEYEFDENRVGPNGVTVKCTNCGHVFKVRRAAAVRSAIPRSSTTIGSGPQGGKEWLVRKPDGQMIAFRELTTLQKWIVEGRVQRDDEISKNGETWKRLGNIMELEPFFSVYEKAQTLNSLIQQQPLELRGSELLAAVNPMDGGQSQAYPIPSRSQILQADPLPSHVPHLPSQIPQTLAAKPPALPHRSPAPSLPGAPVPSMPSAAGPMMDRDSVHSTGLAGAGGLDRNIGPAAAGPPASFHSASLDFPIADDDGMDVDDPVVSFERGRRNKRVVLAALLLVCLAAGASGAVAMYGPKDNAIRALAIKNGLLKDTDDGADKVIEQAQGQADRDAVANQTKAIDLLGQAAALRPSDVTLIADRATYIALLADTFRQWAVDLDEDAGLADEALKAWQELPAARRGPAPVGPKPTATRALAQKKRLRAHALLEQGLPWLLDAETQIPDETQTLRARAAVSAAQQSLDRNAKLAQATKAAEGAGHTDPVLLYLDAVQHMDNGESGYAQARILLDKALTARPSFLRARVLLGRLHILAQRHEDATKELDQVSREAPAHEEAQRLRTRLAAAVTAAKTAAKGAALQPPEPEPEPVKVAKAPAPRKNFAYWMKLGDRQRRRDQTMRALNAYGRAAEIKPNSAEVHVGKGWCLLDLERPHPALVAFERAIRVNNRYAEAYYGQGEALRTLGRKEKALEAYKVYLDRAPSGRERKVVQRRVDELSGS